jgi:hypothetical protein
MADGLPAGDLDTAIRHITGGMRFAASWLPQPLATGLTDLA